MRFLIRAAGLIAVLALTAFLPAQRPSVDQWPVYQHNSNFSPLAQITPENVSKLAEAWTFHYGAGSQDSGSLGLDYRFEVQPLIVGGVMYISTPGSPRDTNLRATITALEPETGKILWQYHSPLNIHGRGLAYWPGTKTVGPRLYVAVDKGYLMSLDLKTHELAQNFANKGSLDVYVGVASTKVGESRRNTFTVPNPAAVYKNLIITSARPGEGSPPQPRGDIRAWDAITGKLVWDFHVIPQPGEPNHEDWTGDTWQDRSGANTWSTMVVDQERGIVFAPTGDSNHADTAPGKNLYANCLLALDATTGKLKWFHQLVHHDVWDFDLPTPPLLIDIHKDGRVIPAVLQTGKMSYVYIFDRVTGEPIYGMEERPVKRSDDPNDQAWPTQPFPIKPGPIARVGMSKDDINKMTPEIEKFCTDFWDNNHLEASGPYARPMSRASIVTFPSSLGGPNWGPLSYNPQLGLVFINVHNSGTFRAARPLPPGGDVATAEPEGGGQGRGRAGGGGRGGGPFRADAFSYKLPSGAAVPCYAPPYGALVAVDVNKGEIAWTSTLGINESLAGLGDAGLKSGARNLGGSLATASELVFIAATNDRRFRAFDAKTGKELWVAELPASGHATPMTYIGKDGSQYVAIAASGGTAVGVGLPISDALVAYRLPK
ncbi:MAG: PQQ-binding-like beta-propeller repeat protein [Bryobacterales bacterium]|nr:PQQ-binding-like beta-propeller repeat protein [Bryobacterales bacterium]MBV9400614.1 PQQ-binding-like beta-propeller repeat protein [Bryobacterales bacterium]